MPYIVYIIRSEAEQYLLRFLIYLLGVCITVGNPTYSPPSPLELYHREHISSIHPDRPIRPLPKRRLRSRLSSEVADSILYASKTSSKPHSQRHNEGSNGSVDESEDRSKAAKESYQFKGNGFGSDDENMVIRRHQEQRQRPIPLTPNSSKAIYTRNDSSRYVKPSMSQSVASSNDSIDGYDSFENTNNKKKRKIPMSGSLGNHQTTLSAEMAQMGLSSTRDIDVSNVEADSGVGHYYGSGSSAIPTVTSGNGISGAGRGRYGRATTRHHTGRSPLGVSMNGSNTLQANRAQYQHPQHRENDLGSVGLKGDNYFRTVSDQGIISTAIANAAALPLTPTRGQENSSLFDQQSSKKPSSTKTQFTFTCESDSAKTLLWPDNQSPLARWDKDIIQAQRGRASQTSGGLDTPGTQGSTNMATQSGEPAPQQPVASGHASQQPRKPRRPLEKQYKIAARDRRLRQEYSNYHHPPKDEDIWICQFCEYESIFGEKPHHLIRQYEAKDRRERKRLAEKRRLLEKAKLKGKKGKKGNKGAKNPSTTAQAQQQNQKQRYDNQPSEELQTQDDAGEGEDYGLDAYEEDKVPLSMPVPQQTPSKIPQPISQNQNHSLRPPFGSAALRQNTPNGRETYF
ncbi:hypothetical protein ACLMJK_003096 [Lecanora helva]